MKKLRTLIGLTLIGSLAFTSRANSQITVTVADMPQAGTAFATAYDTTSSTLNPLSPGAGGTNKTWNISGLPITYQIADLIVNASATPYSASFPGTNLADSTVGLPGYTYFSATSSAFISEGSEFQDRGAMISADYKPAITELNFPAVYGNKDGASTVARVTPIAFTGLGTGVDSAQGVLYMTYADTIDAWGTITTPFAGGTAYPVLRQKHYEYDVDSVYIHPVGGPWMPFPSANVISKIFSYRYYTNNGLGEIVSTITMDTANKKVTSVAWYNGLPVGINEVSQAHNTLVYPNPATSQINFRYSALNAQNVMVYDITGRLLTQVEMKNGIASLNTSSYSSGMYLYRVTDKSGNMLDNGKFSIL